MSFASDSSAASRTTTRFPRIIGACRSCRRAGRVLLLALAASVIGLAGCGGTSTSGPSAFDTPPNLGGALGAPTAETPKNVDNETIQHAYTFENADGSTAYFEVQSPLSQTSAYTSDWTLISALPFVEDSTGSALEETQSFPLASELAQPFDSQAWVGEKESTTLYAQQWKRGACSALIISSFSQADTAAAIVAADTYVTSACRD